MRGSDAALLHALGRRQPELRADRDRTVAELASLAGVSRRHVAEAEAGRANLSLSKLAALARALGVPLRELVDLPLAPLERIALLGLRGAGKSTVGPLLAQDLDAPFLELDRRVEARAGVGMAELLELEGPRTWERLERETLEEVLASGQRLVLEVPGSIVDRPEAFGRVLTACRTVWLQAPPEDHWERVVAQGDLRPMAGRPEARQELAELWSQRRPAYARSELVLATAGRSPAEVVREARLALGV